MIQGTNIQDGSIGRFDPETHRNNVHDAFCEFVSKFNYEYEAIAKDPPDREEDKTRWVQINKRKIFLGKFASRNFQRDYESAVPEDERSNLQFNDLVKKMKDRYEPTRNYTLANYQFHKLRQSEEESFDNFVHRLRHEAGSCKFKCQNEACNVEEVMIRDQIVVGTRIDDIRNNALKNQWVLKDLIENGRKIEAASHTAQCIASDSQNDQDNAVSRVKPKKHIKKRYKPKDRAQLPPSSGSCKTCSDKSCTGGDACRALRATCFTCGRKGHFKGSRSCKGKHSRPSTKRVQSDSEWEETSDSSASSIRSRHRASTDSEPDMPKRRHRRVHRIQSRKKLPVRHQNQFIKPANMHDLSLVRATSKPKYTVKIVIAEHRIRGFADTGADINVMSEKTAHKYNLRLQKTKTRIKPFGSKPIKCVGYYEGFASFCDNVAAARFYVVPLEVETLISGKLCEELGIIRFSPAIRTTRDKGVRAVAKDAITADIMKQHPKTFQGIGTLKHHEVHFHVDNTVPPVAQAARSVPYHLQNKFKNAIKQMEEDGIIEEHHGPAPWVSNVVLTPKDDGNIRVTVDLREVNKCIQATNIPIPRVEDIKAKLSGCRVFSKLDFKSAFHQLTLDKESRILTVFHAGQRLMRYRKLTMGAKPASGELTKALIPIFANMKGVHIIHDDVIIAGEDKESHDKALRKALTKIESTGMTLNPDKCVFRKKEIPFWGMIVTKRGVKPDPAKVMALRRTSRPCSKDEVRSFLCFIQSFGDFIPLLSRKTSHLRKLTKKHKEFQWSDKCEEEFKAIRKCLHQDAMLRYFDTSLPTFVFVDAHTSGISAILAQGKSATHCKPVSFASRATRPEEQRYPQLDLEATAVDFGLRRFRNYVVGGPCVQVITDHKPLVSIFSNTRKGSIRTDRIKLRHQDIPFQVTWDAGRNNPADYLSRHAQPLNEIPLEWQKESDELNRTVFWLRHSPYTEAISLDRIRSETKSDATLKRLKGRIRKGYIPKSDTALRAYRMFFDQLTIANGFVMKQDKIVLPQSLWETAVDKAHKGHHPGISQLKNRIREHFWMPELNKLAEEKVKKCKMCQLYTNTGSKQPQRILSVPSQPWQDLSLDLFGPMPDGKHIIVVQDIMTRFPDAKIIPSTSAKYVIPAIQETYETYGRPTTHKTDNGPPFNGRDFKNFSSSYGIQHKTSYPYHPQANPVETFMKTLGKTMKICHTEGKNKAQALRQLLASYRSTPHRSTGQSPGNLMFHGGYKQDFPRKALTREDIEEARQLDKQAKITRQTFVNSSCRRKRLDIKEGDRVYVRNATRNKFDPLFGPEQHEVISVYDDGIKIKRLEDGKHFIRHLNDVKLVTDEWDNNSSRHRQYAGDGWLWCCDNEQRGQQLNDEQRVTTHGQPVVENEETIQRNMPQTDDPQQPTYRPRALSRLADYNSPGFSEMDL